MPERCHVFRGGASTSEMRWISGVVLTLAVAACDEVDGNKSVPDTALEEVPAAISNQRHIRISFRALGNANRFLCKLDGSEPSMCIAPFEADVADGEHTFEVAAALNLNIDETPATHTWRVDATVPETTLLSA